MDTRGKTALITGGARRVGRAIGLELAQAGCDVAVHYHTSPDGAREVADRIEALGRRAVLVAGDLADPGAAAAIVAETVRLLGRLDILVNNASVYDETAVSCDAGAEWERILRVNLVAPAMLSAAAVPHMRQLGAGRIINLSDILAVRPIRNHGAYCASKAGLDSLTRSLAIDLAPEITVNAVAPGIAVFPESYDAQKRQRLLARVPLGREGTPADIAEVVRFLITSGDYITGQTITVDGGWTVPR